MQYVESDPIFTFLPFLPLDTRITDYDKIIAQAAREDARSLRLMERPGIGPITASALLASIGNGHDFKNGRQVAAWIGLTPGQHSSGGRARLGHFTKAGNSYLRSLLVMHWFLFVFFLFLMRSKHFEPAFTCNPESPHHGLNADAMHENRKGDHDQGELNHF